MSGRILLFSGGLDSFITWRMLDKPQCLYVRLGQPYEQAELGAIGSLLDCVDIHLVEASLGRHYGHLAHHDGHIPHRNLALVTAAAALGAESVCIGALRGETSRDKSGRFLRDASRLLTYLEHPVEVVAPFRHLTKTKLVAAYLERFPSEHDRGLLSRTRSCYDWQGPSCGECQACMRRWVAMTLNGIEEEYRTPPARAMRNILRRQPGRPWAHLIRTPLVELPGVVAANAEAVRAMLGAKR